MVSFIHLHSFVFIHCFRSFLHSFTLLFLHSFTPLFFHSFTSLFLHSFILLSINFFSNSSLPLFIHFFQSFTAPVLHVAGSIDDSRTEEDVAQEFGVGEVVVNGEDRLTLDVQLPQTSHVTSLCPLVILACLEVIVWLWCGGGGGGFGGFGGFGGGFSGCGSYGGREMFVV